ncbi:MAG: XRE family transcriptional regulator [Peptococcaceae bacterium]|nr:MAG: XRE family transcriptional regulator [Peptococcaceae bacterium]
MRNKKLGKIKLVKAATALKTIRIVKKYTQNDIKELTGYSRSLISSIERGIWSGKLSTLKTLFGKLGIDVKKIL